MTKQGSYKNCERCNTPFYEYPYLSGKRRFCSKTCSNKTTGSQVSQTKRRKSSTNVLTNKKKWRYTWAYVNWRTQVFARDGYLCTECGSDKSIIAHHIKSYESHPNLRIDVDNGITLCRTCHNRLDTRIKSGQFK